MSYRRNSNWRSNWENEKPVTVTLAWSALVGAYDLKFEDIRGDQKWGKVKGVIAWLKMTIPYGERDYDDVSKIWTIHEKYFTQLRDILNALGEEFNVTCVERPVGGPAITFTPIEVYFDRFRDLSGVDIRKLGESEFSQAKKIYFKTAMALHPDRNGSTEAAHKMMRDFNETWDVIKERHFKQTRVMSQVTE